MKGALQALDELFARRVHGASLAAFRVAFGLVVFLQAAVLVWPAPGGSTIQRTLTGAHVQWTLPFAELPFVGPWPAPWMSVELVLVGLAGLALALGLASRLAAIAIMLGWTHVWLADATSFNNHYYLISLLALALALAPSGACFGIGAWWKARGEPAACRHVPFWSVLLLRVQLFIVYFFGGLAKLTRDYLVEFEPVRSLLRLAPLPERVGPLLGAEAAEAARRLVSSEFLIGFVSYTGVVFDLLVGFLLVCRRTRYLAIALALLFHATNHFALFDDIGLFPLLAALATLIFLEPDWPLRVGRFLKNPSWSRPDWHWFVGGALLVPLVGALLGWKARAARSEPGLASTRLRPITWFVLAWTLVQVGLPLRHLAIPGDVLWTTEGNLFSWRMKNSVRARDLHAVLVRDPALVRVEDGREQPRFDRWDGPRVVLRHVSAETVDWAALPPLLVVRQPLTGDRLIYNPMSGGRRESLAEATAKVKRAWFLEFGREPELRDTLPLGLALKAFAQAIERGGGAPDELETLLSVDAHLTRLQQPGRSESERHLDAHRVQEGLRKLLVSETLAPAMRLLLRACHPLSLEGAAEPPQRLLVIDDPLLLPSSLGATLNREALRDVLPGADELLLDFRRLPAGEWRALPSRFFVRDEHDRLVVWWSFERDLSDPVRRNWVAAYPVPLMQYARRVATLWEQEHGRRPEVRCLFRVGVNMHEARWLVDPGVDLASVERNVLLHAQWIVPPDSVPDPALPLAY